ncbi:MAG: glycosyltransferase family 2 protein, partial [Gammaproteobacteria bacterium]|nr:glycosyltransferase family 2 protein [Gammaproteobacteria bacterium]
MLFNGLVIFGIRAHYWGRVLVDTLSRMVGRPRPGKAD